MTEPTTPIRVGTFTEDGDTDDEGYVTWNPVFPTDCYVARFTDDQGDQK